MTRRRYLVAYDIREAKRLRDVHSAMKAFGYPLQYSVFVCDLDGMEKVHLRQIIGGLIHHRQDSLAIVDLGDVGTRGMECFEFMGVAPPLPGVGPRIV
ncbi:MAG: CRISPR-associated endonuclease Cas2 [Actinomycetota bacterium]